MFGFYFFKILFSKIAVKQETIFIMFLINCFNIYVLPQQFKWSQAFFDQVTLALYSAGSKLWLKLSRVLESSWMEVLMCCSSVGGALPFVLWSLLLLRQPVFAAPAFPAIQNWFTLSFIPSIYLFWGFTHFQSPPPPLGKNYILIDAFYFFISYFYFFLIF